MLVQGALAHEDVKLISETECAQISKEIQVWDELVERATLNLIFRKEVITIPNVVNELVMMGYEVQIHECALQHLIIKDVRKVVSTVSVL